MANSGGRESGRGVTRLQILAELCGGRLTANEIAQDFGISGTAVRHHLRSLADDGLVHHSVERRGVGKPTHVYELTAEGHALLSKAYVPVLAVILDALATRHGEDGLAELLRAAGRSLAEGELPAAGSLRRKADAAAEALEKLGALVRVVKQRGGYAIQGRCCPLAPLSPRFPALCGMIESLLRELTGAEVRESCERGTPPRCQFALTQAR